jgi:pimeloyl-ACP methyl ester carboxylesterase
MVSEFAGPPFYDRLQPHRVVPEVTLRESSARFVEVDGVRLRVRVDGDGSPLLLIAGVAASIEAWGPLRRLLSGRQVISFDAPGVGASPPFKRPARMPRLARLVARLLDRLECPHADVLGHSFGGVLALQLTRSHPERVRRLILAATIPGVGGVQNPFTVMRLFNPRGAWRLHEPRPHKVVGRLVGGVTRENVTAYEAYETMRLAHPWSHIGYAQQAFALCGWSSIPWLQRIQQPTLVLAGDDDPLVPVVNSLIFTRLMPHSQRHIVSAGGHLFLVDEPERVAGLIDDFLSRPS